MKDMLCDQIVKVLDMYNDPEDLLVLVEEVDYEGNDCFWYLDEYDMYSLMGCRIMDRVIQKKWNGKFEINAMILALECGALKLKNVTEWADSLILKADEPDFRLFDVSVSKSTNDAVVSLQKFGVSDDSELVAKKAFSLFVAALESNATNYEKVSQKIYEMTFEPNMLIPDQNAEGQMMSFWDSLDIANDGIYGDPFEIKRDMLAFLKKYES